MIWYIENLLRHRQERLALDELAASASWLTLGAWHIDSSLRLRLNITISVERQSFEVTLRYPSHFPHSPVLVIPTSASDVRWSDHQWGAGGELCLEWGSDNWHPDVTGAMMIESAERLLRGESHVRGEDGVPTRHKLTIGQKLRGKSLLFLMTSQLQSALAEIEEAATIKAKMVVCLRDHRAVYFVREIIRPDESPQDIGIPDILKEEGWERPLSIFRLAAGQPLPPTDTLEHFRAAMEEWGFVLGEEVQCVVLRGGDALPFRLWPKDNSISQIPVISTTEIHRRLNDEYDDLAGKKVALIGCGSLGSKIGTSLARCGVGSFLLVDDDLVLPENMLRHDLDWREVGQPKAKALSRRIRLVNASSVVQTRVHRLGGQEASDGIETLIEAIARCDLILDCTADPKAYNYLCAAVAGGKKPMVWGEVFGGGIGGFIARHRPGLDPDPATMRAIVDQACRDRGKPTTRSDRGYEHQNGDDPPLIADDADVSVIASHAARLAVDVLLERSPSMFPVSAYLIGMSEGYIFEQPFETWPIDVGQPVSDSEDSVELAGDIAEEEIAHIRRLFEKYSDAADHS